MDFTSALPIVQLMQTKGVGPVRIRKLIEVALAHEVSLGQLMSEAPATAVESIGFSEEEFADFNGREPEASRILDVAEQSGCQVWSPQLDPPQGDVDVARLPPLLFYKGNFDPLQQKGVAIAGSRNAGSASQEAAHGLATVLVSLQWTVVSGHARGIDRAAHVGALEAGGCTVAVLAEGMANFKVDAGVRGVADEDRLLLLSEFLPEEPWKHYRAMPRNKTILGLSEALIVFDSGDKGGTHAASLTALDQHIPLGVVVDPRPAQPEVAKELIQAGGIPLKVDGDAVEGLEQLFEGKSAQQGDLFGAS